MSEIYLAASNKTEINLLGKAIHTKMKGTKIKEISMEEFKEVLYSEFDLLVISPEYLSEPSKIALDRITGKKLCYWHSDYIQQIVDSKIYVFSDIKAVYQWLYQGEAYNDEIAFTHSNGEFIKKGEKKIVAPSSHNKKKTGTNSQKEQLKTTHNDTKPNSPSEQNFEKKEKKVEPLEEEQEVNDAKPVSVKEPYPELEENVKQRLVSEFQDKKPFKKGEDVESDQEPAKDVVHSPPTPDIQYEHDPYSERAVAIRKEAFSYASWDRNQTIGIWSPLHRMGVTTLTFNIAMHFGKLKIPTAAVEGLTNNQLFRSMLSQYSNPPEGWTSFLSALQDENTDATKVEWTYNNVHWLPIGDSDVDNHEWTKDHLRHYLSSAKYFDLVFVDLPTGKMAQHTLDTIEHIDELWILIDGSYDQVLAWKSYIHSVLKEYELSVKLIFMKEYSFSKPKKIADKLDLPLLTTIPDLSEAIYRNYLEKKPLIDQTDTYRLLERPLTTICEHILGEEFIMSQKTSFFKKLKWFLQA